jgi:hypothetical protein
MNNKELLRNFGEHIGIRNMTFGYQKSCSLNINDSHLINIIDINDSALLVSVVLGNIDAPQFQSSEVTLELLSMNMLFASVNGPVVSYEPVNKSVLLSRAIDSAELSPVVLEEQIKYLVENCEHVRSTLAERNVQLMNA